MLSCSNPLLPMDACLAAASAPTKLKSLPDDSVLAPGLGHDLVLFLSLPVPSSQVASLPAACVLAVCRLGCKQWLLP